MKTTIEIHDDLLVRAEQYARKTGRPLYAIKITLGACRLASPMRTTESKAAGVLSVASIGDT